MKNLFALVLVLLVFDQITFAQKVSNRNGDWATANTWTPSGAPTAGQTVTINHNVTVSSVTNVVGAVTVSSGSNRSLVVNGGTLRCSSLTASNNLTNNGGTITLTGNLTQSAGTFGFSASPSLNFSGTGSQTITGTINVFDLNVNTGSVVSLAASAQVNINGTLTLAGTGSYDADGLGSGVTTIKSTGNTSGGAIGNLPDPARFTGNVTIERLIDGDESWRYLSMPIASGNVGDWKNSGLPVSGNFSDPSPTDGIMIVDNTAPSIYEYDAVTTGDFRAIGTGGTVASTGLDFRKGYAVYTYNSSDFVLSVTGDINKGSVSLPVDVAPNVSDTRRWNLVSNPYPSTIDSDLIDFSDLGSTAVYIRQSTTVGGTVASYSQGGSCTGCSFDPSWTGEIAIGQSFWVENLLGAVLLPLNEGAKTSGSFTFLRKETPTNLFRVTLASSTQKDDLIISFKDQALTNFDKRDATKRKNGDPTGLGYNTYINLSSITEDGTRNLAINTMPHLTKSTVVKLSMEDVVPGNHTLEFTQLETLSLGYKIVLIDKFASKEVEVVNGLKYNFAVSSDAKTFGNDRFSLRIDVSNLTTAIEDEANELVQVYPNPVADKLIVELDQKSKNAIKQIDLVDSRGSLLESILPEAFSDKISIDLSSRCTGIYIVKVFRSNGASVHKIVKR
jgi:hypothetical protein